MVLGHEGAGTVESVGDGVVKFQPGSLLILYGLDITMQSAWYVVNWSYTNKIFKKKCNYWLKNSPGCHGS